jgi:hypothetical protein
MLGDFDGDQRLDHAILITYSVADSSKYAVLAFLTRNDGVEQHTLDTGEILPSMYLSLIRASEPGYDYVAEREFRYSHDAIRVWYIFGKNAAAAFEYRDGRFVKIRTVD